MVRTTGFDLAGVVRLAVVVFFVVEAGGVFAGVCCAKAPPSNIKVDVDVTRKVVRGFRIFLSSHEKKTKKQSAVGIQHSAKDESNALAQRSSGLTPFDSAQGRPFDSAQGRLNAQTGVNTKGHEGHEEIRL